MKRPLVFRLRSPRPGVSKAWCAISFCSGVGVRLFLTCLTLLALMPLASQAHSSQPQAADRLSPDPARQQTLIHLVRQDCGACHGLTLQGGLGSPLTAAALRDKPFDSLVATILHGRNGTPMPPFKSMLSEHEARWIVEQLQKGFPDAH